MQREKRIPLDRISIKNDVRARLSGRVLVCFLACAIPSLLSWAVRLVRVPFGIVNMTIAGIFEVGISLPGTALAILASVLVTEPIQVKVASFFLSLNRNPETLPSPLTVCDCFGPGYLRLVSAMLQKSLRVLAWAIVPVLVALLIPGAWEVVEVVPGVKELHIADFIYIAMLASMLLSVYRELAYRMVPYLLSDYPEMTPGEALRESLRMTRGRILELFVLELSFFGWLVLTSVTLMIGAVYTYPYIEGTMAAYYDGFRQQALLLEEMRTHAD